MLECGGWRDLLEGEVREHPAVFVERGAIHRGLVCFLGVEGAGDDPVLGFVVRITHGVTSTARNAVRSFCIPQRMRYFTVPSGSASATATCRYDMPSK